LSESGSAGKTQGGADIAASATTYTRILLILLRRQLARTTREPAGCGERSLLNTPIVIER